MSFVSYAQNFEDIILWRALKDVKNGYYIDIGSQDPISHSVSYGFSLNGWKGLSVEPTDQYVNSFRHYRPHDDIIKAFVSDEKKLIDFYVFKDTGLSTADLEIATKHKASGFEYHTQKIKTITIQDVWKLAKTNEIHWLKIDVEGYEQKVLNGWNDDMRPWILVIEATQPLSKESTHQNWEHLIFSKGYQFVYADGLNRFYLHEKHLRLKPFFQFPPNVLEDNYVTHSTILNEKRAHDAEAEKHKLELTAETQTALLNEKTQALAAHESTIKEQHAHVETLQAALNEAKEAQKTLLDEKAQTLAAHESTIKEQHTHVETLQAALNEAKEAQKTLLDEKAQAAAAHESTIKEQHAHVETLQAALKEAKEAQKTLLDGKAQAVAAHESTIKEQHTHVETLQAALKEANEAQKALLDEKAQALAAHESTIKEKQAHVETLQAALKEANEAQKTLLDEKAQAVATHESTIKEKQAHVETLQAALKEANEAQKALLDEKAQAVAAAESTSKEKQSHIETLQSAIQISNAHLCETKEELMLAKSQIDTLKAILTEKETALASTQGTLAEQQKQFQALQNDRESAEVKIAELNASSHHWWTVADHLTHELQAVYKSKSWWLTRPLREVNWVIKRWPYRVRTKIVAALKSLVRKPTQSGIRLFALQFRSISPALFSNISRMLWVRRIYFKLLGLHDKPSLVFRDVNKQELGGGEIIPTSSHTLSCVPDFSHEIFNHMARTIKVTTRRRRVDSA